MCTETISVIQTSWRKLIWEHWFPYITAMMTITTGRPCWGKKTKQLSQSGNHSYSEKKTLICALTHLTEWAAGRQSSTISQVISFCSLLFHLSPVWYSPFSGCVFLSESIKVLIAFNTKIISVTCCLEWKTLKKMTWLHEIHEISNERECGEEVKWTEWWHIYWIKHSAARRNPFSFFNTQMNKSRTCLR